jgi:hypothetical protein
MGKNRKKRKKKTTHTHKKNKKTSIKHIFQFQYLLKERQTMYI